MAAVEHLAGRIGPRHATSAAYAEAARWVAGRLRDLGYRVHRQRVPVPGGSSWGVPVEAGTSVNVVARLPGTDLRRPHLVVGAHLDTVPQAPGAEDNASGIGVLLAAAEAAAERRTRLPVVFVAFGAEEPRGPTDADHHYGSRAYVAALGPAERRAVRGMVSLDRVGRRRRRARSGSATPGGDPAQRAVLAAAGAGRRTRGRRGEPLQRPLVLRARRAARRPARQHAVRRLPLAPRTCPPSSSRPSSRARAGCCWPGCAESAAPERARGAVPDVVEDAGGDRPVRRAAGRSARPSGTA